MANALQRSNNALMRSQVTPEQMNAGAMRRRMNAFEEEQARKAAEIQQFGRPLNNFERMTTTLPVSDSPADIQSNLANVMGSTWGGGMAANVLENPIRAAGGLLNPRRSAGYVPLTTYHGSPHRINNVDEANPMGRFDLAKVGTGEGAQAYGHGIYLAENPEVGKMYQRVVTDGGGGWGGGFNDDVAAFAANLPEEEAGRLLANYQLRGPESAKAMVDDWLRKGVGGSDAKVHDALIDLSRADWSPKGHFYTVDLPDEHIEKMLDWDAPLSEQSEGVRAAIARAASDLPNPYIQAGIDKGVSMQALYHEIGQGLAPDGKSMKDYHAAASDWLKNQGIPGIRYFDGSSRAAGEGTRNFVIFDPDIAKILNRE